MRRLWMEQSREGHTDSKLNNIIYDYRTRHFRLQARQRIQARKKTKRGNGQVT